MGTWKLGLPFRETTIFGASLCSAASFAATVIVVSGYQASELTKMVDALRPKLNAEIIITHNVAYQRGMFSSIQRGAEALEGVEQHPFFISLADMPEIQPDHYSILAEATGNASIVRPIYNNIPGHPVLCKPEVRPSILAQPPGGSMKEVLSLHQVYEMAVQDPAIIRDTDTPLAYQALLARGEEIGGR